MLVLKAPQVTPARAARLQSFRRRARQTRKPRHPLLRIALGLLGVAMLAVLLVVGLFVGAAMILFGITRRLLVRRPTARPDARIVEAEYRVVRERNQAALR